MPPAPRALTALGPAYIKFGQVLSTRPDVVGDELASQLTVLQDKLPPFSTEIAKQNIAHELGVDADVIFSAFQPRCGCGVNRAGTSGDPATERRRGCGQSPATRH